MLSFFAVSGVKLPRLQIPFFGHTVRAGFPSPAVFPCRVSYQYIMLFQKVVLEQKVSPLGFNAFFLNCADICQQAFCHRRESLSTAKRLTV